MVAAIGGTYFPNKIICVRFHGVSTEIVIQLVASARRHHQRALIEARSSNGALALALATFVALAACLAFGSVLGQPNALATSRHLGGPGLGGHNLCLWGAPRLGVLSEANKAPKLQPGAAYAGTLTQCAA